jgi:hypothetical protein
MENKEKENPLKMHEETPAKAASPRTDSPTAAEKPEDNPTAEKAGSFELPASYLLAAELQEMYDEDKVVHRQGHSEPESD